MRIFGHVAKVVKKKETRKLKQTLSQKVFRLKRQKSARYSHKVLRCHKHGKRASRNNLNTHNF